jgi:hypothetical protein
LATGRGSKSERNEAWRVVINLYQVIKDALNARKNRVLTIAQASLPEHQFHAFKKLYLDEMGERGFEKELKQLLEKQHGMDRNGRE